MARPNPKLYDHLTNKERMLQGFPYDDSTAELTKERQRAKKLLQEFNAINDTETDKKIAVLKTLFHPDSGQRIYVEPTFKVKYGSNITFGENGVMNFDGVIQDTAPVKIGKNFMAGPGVRIFTETQPIDGDQERRDWRSAKSVTIGDDVWIGGTSVICPGVTIGTGVVVGAHSIVTKDVPDYVLVAGNPAKIIKHIPKSLVEIEPPLRTD